MTNTFWEAVKIALWDFRPHAVDVGELEASDETPGAREKLEVLTEHLRRAAAYSDSTNAARSSMSLAESFDLRRPWRPLASSSPIVK